MGNRDHRLPLKVIEELVTLWHDKASYIRAGYGFARSRNGAANMHAVTCLPSVTGAWHTEGGGALWSNRGMYHWNKTLMKAWMPSTPGSGPWT